MSEVAQRLGVSTMPVREAVRRLEAEGLVTFDRRNGIQPSLLSPLEFEEITELRVRLETLAFERAMAHVERVDRERLDRLLEEMQHAEDRREWRSLNYEFHDTLYASGDYPRLLKMIATLRIPVEPYLRLYTSDPPDLHGAQTRDRLLFDDHRYLVDALDRRDLTEGLRLVEQHIRRFRSLASQPPAGEGESGPRSPEAIGDQHG